MDREHRAFTLIELLVVVAIISLLVSILLPSLTKARDLARISVCATQLHSLHLAIEFYVNDHVSEYPYLRQVTQSGFFGYGNWPDLRPLLNPYIGNPEVMYCPAGGTTYPLNDGTLNTVRGPDNVAG